MYLRRCYRRKDGKRHAYWALVEVALPARTGVTIRKRCISRPTEHQAILLQRLGLRLPATLEFVAV